MLFAVNTLNFAGALRLSKMHDSLRGKIRNRDKKRRLMDFSSLRWGRITPTDIDAAIDFHNRLFIIVEAKGQGVPVPRGQEWALERILLRLDQPNHTIESLRSAGAVLIADVPDGGTDDDVDLGLCIVREYWRVRVADGVFPYVHKHSISTGATVRDAIDALYNAVIVDAASTG